MPVPNRRTKTIAGRDAHHFQGPLFPERRNAILPPLQRPSDLHVSIAAEDPLICRGLAVRSPRLVVSSASAAAALSRPTKPKVVQQRLIVVAAPQIVEDQDQTKFHLPTSKFLFSHIKNKQLPVFELAIIRALSSNNRHQEPKNTHTHTHTLIYATTRDSAVAQLLALRARHHLLQGEVRGRIAAPPSAAAISATPIPGLGPLVATPWKTGEAGGGGDVTWCGPL